MGNNLVCHVFFQEIAGLFFRGGAPLDFHDGAMVGVGHGCCYGKNV